MAISGRHRQLCAGSRIFGQGRNSRSCAAALFFLLPGLCRKRFFGLGRLLFRGGLPDLFGQRGKLRQQRFFFLCGLAVGVAFGALQRGASPEAVMGAVSIAFGIGLQNFPEGAAVSMPLRREGAGRLRSFLLGQASGLVEPVAGVLGALLVGSVEAILPYALAFAAGAMILVAVHELIPECQRNREARPYTATMGIVAGFAIMMLLDVALG